MEPKRAGDPGGAVPRTLTKKPKSTSRVKVVASRYAQALQNKNLENSRARAGSISSATAATAGRPRAPGVSSSGATAVSAARPSVTVTPSAHVLAKRAHAAAAHSVATTPATAATPHTSYTPTIATASSPVKQDLKERLKAYKASKALLAHAAPTNAPAAVAMTSSRVMASATKPRAVAKPGVAKSPHSTTTRDRPTFPKRIGGALERSSKRPAKVAADPVRVETTVLATTARPLAAGATPRTPRTGATGPALAPSLAAAPSVSTTDDDDRDLLEGLYVQLCYTEMRATAAFRQQEQAAERQLLAAWHVLQTKLQLLHDTALRLDREQHVRELEANLNDQAAASTQLASRLPAYLDDLGAVCSALEASLLRLPTRNVRCRDPHELGRRVAALTTELTALLTRVHATKLDTTVANAVAFERAIAQTADATSALLLQVANAVDALVREVTTETSLRVEQIQRERVAAMRTAADADAADNDSSVRGSDAWWWRGR